MPCRNHAYRDQGRLIYIQEEIDGLTAAAIAVAVASTLPDTDANRTARKLSDLLRWLLCARSKDINSLHRRDTVRLFSVSTGSDFYSNELLALNKFSF